MNTLFIFLMQFKCGILQIVWTCSIYSSARASSRLLTQASNLEMLDGQVFKYCYFIERHFIATFHKDKQMWAALTVHHPLQCGGLRYSKGILTQRGMLLSLKDGNTIVYSADQMV